MSNQGHKQATTDCRSQLTHGWQLLAAIAIGVLLVALKLLAGDGALGSGGQWAGLLAVATALVATCLLIVWVGTAAPALLFMTVFLVMVGYVPIEVATKCLKEQLADPFVVIVFSGFTLLTLLFGMTSERGTPPAWALRPGELVGRDGEGLRAWMGRVCLQWLADPFWSRLGALLPGLVTTLISSGLGADAMARMAAIPKKNSEAADQKSSPKSREDEQNTRASVFVLTACVLAPALIPVSLWGLFFSMQAGKVYEDAGVSWWLAASYPCVMAVLLPGWLWWSTRAQRQPICAYYGMYALAWGVIVGLAMALQHCTKEQFALGLLVLTVLYSSFRVLRRCWWAMNDVPATGSAGGGHRLSVWVSKVEWELIKGGFSRALGIVVIVVFAAIFRKAIETAVPAGNGLAFLAEFPITALAICVLAILGIGISIGTAFGTFVLGLALVRIVWPAGLPAAGDAPILFWMLVSVSAAVNQISQQADNLEVMEKYEDKGVLARQVSGVVLPVLALSMIFSFAGWIYCTREIFSWKDLVVGLVLLICGGSLALRWSKKDCTGNRPDYGKRRFLWLGVMGESARTLIGESRIAGEFISSYDADNDMANVKPENAAALLRTVLLEGKDAWAFAEGRAKADTLLLLIGFETTAVELLNSPLVARCLRDGHPRIRVARISNDGCGCSGDASEIIKRMGGENCKVQECIGRDGLKTLAREITACLDYREGDPKKPGLQEWLFPSSTRPSVITESTILKVVPERSAVT